MYDIVVVGAGLSGLVSVYFILKKKPNLKIIIVEKEMKCGGQITDRIGCEGRWFSREQKHLVSLCEDLNLAYVKYPIIPKCFRHVWEFEKTAFALLAKWELQRFMDNFDLMTNLSTTEM